MLPTTRRPTGFAGLSPQQQHDHRVKIGLMAEAIMGAGWRQDTPDAVRALEMENWMDLLQNLSMSEIKAAWQSYQLDTRNRTATGALRRPDPARLSQIALAKRPKPALVSHNDTPGAVEPVGKERAAEIMAQHGFGVKRIPK